MTTHPSPHPQVHLVDVCDGTPTTHRGVTRHNDTCPRWCAARPGGPTRPTPYAAKANTVRPGTIWPTLTGADVYLLHNRPEEGHP